MRITRASFGERAEKLPVRKRGFMNKEVENEMEDELRSDCLHELQANVGESYKTV
ncbi:MULTISPECIES: hypothetical protein [Fischerella]|uniref:hypothetical protein n=1 Tax=Fischerella TaxID=1190 RepID=UPI0002D357AF|nr:MULTISPECIES: hypothetical protein [Fischerella]MBD2430043.1 hypothetical protein [Fischerella sp. FACHB-380]